MAKYLDETGAEQLNQLLAAKFDTKVDKYLATKTYTNILGVANDTTYAENTFYFASIKPTTFTDTWAVRYRIYIWCENDNNYRAMAECWFMGAQSTIPSYAIFNNIYSTSYRPAYYHTMYRLLQDGFNAGYGHALGFSLKDANAKDTAGKERTVKVDILQQVNCQVTLLDNVVKWGSWEGNNTTNYSGADGSPSTYNFSGNGLQETGDANDNTIAYIIKSYYEKTKVGPNKLFQYNLCTYTSENKLEGFVNSASTGTTKTKNTSSFRIGAPIYYYSSKTNLVQDNVAGDNTLFSQNSTIDLRYSTNCNKTLTANLPVYLVGIPSGANFTLADTWWTQTLPNTEDGKIYILLGIGYSTYQIAFNIQHPVYEYKNGAIRLYTDDTNYIKPIGGIPKTDLASDVQTSLGKADTALQSYTETDPTVPSHVKNITNTDISNWNNKGNGTITKVQANGTDVASSGTANIPAASTSAYGVTKLSSATDSTSEVLAATPKAVKAAYDLAAGKGTGTITGVSVNGTSVATSGVANITSVPASILSGAIPSAVTATTQSASDNSTKIATTAFVQTAIDNLPEPMVFKGSLGTGGTITALPTNGAANIGDTYKVITAGTYASKEAKVGDTFICLTKTSSANTWELIPSGDEPSGTVTSVTIKATSPIAVSSSSAITTSGERTISHATSGVTVGTYRSVTVNDTGHVTAGTNPTTISGYGITDAKIASGTITLGSNTITPLTSSSTLDATKVSGTLPADTYTDTKNTAGSTDSSSRLYLIGATSQAANPQTYSDDEIYVENGSLTIGTRKDGTIGTNSFAQGKDVLASNNYSHAEGWNSTASSSCSHAEGYTTTASGSKSHAEGNNTTASNNSSHAEGSYTTASGYYSHAEGYYTTASNNSSHAEGMNTTASGEQSHAEGINTTAQRRSQHVQGEYNILDTEGSTSQRGTYAHIVGNGAADSSRSNAHTLDWSGNAWFSGDVYVGSTSGTNKDAGSKKLPSTPITSEFIYELTGVDTIIEEPLFDSNHE